MCEMNKLRKRSKKLINKELINSTQLKSDLSKDNNYWEMYNQNQKSSRIRGSGNIQHLESFYSE